MKYKKILIFSHERSGTHFLINTIACNFGYKAQQIDIDQTQGITWSNPDSARAWFGRYLGMDVPCIFKSHHTCPFMEPLLPELLDKFHVFYISRNGRDVMTSFWRYLNTLAPGWGPQTGTVGEFMRATPFGGILQYQHRQSLNMLQRWIDHLKSWKAVIPAINYLTYEELYEDYDSTTGRLADILKMELKGITRPGIDAPSSLPWKGIVGNWKNYFSQDDINYYDSLMPPEKCGLYSTRAMK